MKTNFLIAALLLIGTAAIADETTPTPSPTPVKKYECFVEGTMSRLEDRLNQKCDRNKPLSLSVSATDYTAMYTACCVQK